MKKTVNFTFLLTLFLAVFLPFREAISLYTTGFVKFIPDVFIWVSALVIVIRTRFRLYLKTFDFAFGGFILLGLISTLMNSSSLLAFALQTRSIATMYVFFYLLRNISLEKKQINIIVNVLMGVAFLLVGFGIIEHIWCKTIFFPEVWASNILYASNFARLYSLMDNPNTFAFFLYMVIIAVYSFNRKNHRAIHYIFYLVAFFGIVLSASRSTFIALVFFFALLVFYGFKKKEWKNLIAVSVCAVVAFVLVYPVNAVKSAVLGSDSEPGGIAIVDRFEEMQSDEIITQSSGDGRLYMIKKGFEIFADHPVLGTGFGTYGSAGSRMVDSGLYEKYGMREGLYSDNEYIKVIVETGIMGVLMYAIFALSLFKYCLKSKYKVVAFLSFMFIGMFYNMFEVQSLTFVFYFIVAIMNNDVGESDNEKISEKNIQ